MKKKNKLGKINIFINKYSLPLLIILLIITTILLVIVKVTLGGSIKAENKIVKNLYSYVSNDEIEKCGGLLFYSDEKVTKEKLTDEQKTCLAFIKTQTIKGEKIILNKDKNDNICSLEKGKIFATDNYEESKCSIQKYKTDEILKTSKEIFGKEITLKDSFTLDNYNICYLVDDYYYCGLSETFSFTIGNESYVYRVIYKAIEKGKDEIIIYDYFVKITNDLCYPTFTSNKENKKCSENYNSDKVNYKFVKKYGTKFKHVFKKLEGSDDYYWLSSEPM